MPGIFLIPGWGNRVGRYIRLPTFGEGSYFWGGVVVLVLPVLVALLFLLVFFVLAFLVVAVLVESGFD